MDLAFLVGEWEMTLSNASFLPEPNQPVSGLLLVEPIEDGMLLAMRQVGDPAGPPLASWVIGRDASRPDYTVLYTDNRGVSRVYDMRFTGDVWTIWRDDPEFSQRFEATVSADRHTADGRWHTRAAGGKWEHDFDVAHARR
jgi:hypothetical protein